MSMNIGNNNGNWNLYNNMRKGPKLPTYEPMNIPPKTPTKVIQPKTGEQEATEAATVRQTGQSQQASANRFQILNNIKFGKKPTAADAKLDKQMTDLKKEADAAPTVSPEVKSKLNSTPKTTFKEFN